MLHGTCVGKNNLWVISLQPYADPLWSRMKATHAEEVSVELPFSNFDVVSKTAKLSTERLHPEIFDDRFMFKIHAPGFSAVAKSLRSVANM